MSVCLTGVSWSLGPRRCTIFHNGCLSVIVCVWIRAQFHGEGRRRVVVLRSPLPRPETRLIDCAPRFVTTHVFVIAPLFSEACVGSGGLQQSPCENCCPGNASINIHRCQHGLHAVSLSWTYSEVPGMFPHNLPPRQTSSFLFPPCSTRHPTSTSAHSLHNLRLGHLAHAAQPHVHVSPNRPRSHQ